MKEFNKGGVFCLTAKVPEGYVKVMRVGDVDYIWTEGKGVGFLYIILIPDLTRGYEILVTLDKDDYTFAEIQNFKNIITRYEYDKDTAGDSGIMPRRQYMPYIFQYNWSHHASVGKDPGNNFDLDALNDWHYKFYTLDCTGDQDSREKIWRPPNQGTGVGFGVELLPVWYSMSPISAHGYKWCLEAAIDQSKRAYYPINIDVILSSEAISIDEFVLVGQIKKRYNFLYKNQLARFYGKNAYSEEIDPVTGESSIVTFGESIFLAGVGTSNIPVDTDPILFFWPWIPYLDDIRSFNLLFYGPKSEFGSFIGWYMYPSLDAFKKWSIGYYNRDGAYQTKELFSDNATFSGVTFTTDDSDDTALNPCGCGNCGTQTRIGTQVISIPPYQSSGTKNVPIGLLGGLIPISMRTSWTQSGNGLNTSARHEGSVEGNYPAVSLSMGGSIIYWYEYCGISSFMNSMQRTSNYTEDAKNEININQVLKVGEDVIFSGESLMSYDMSYEGQETFSGSIHVTVDHKIDDCFGGIGYVTSIMLTGESQGLYVVNDSGDPIGPDPDKTYEWQLSGPGGLSQPPTGLSVGYTAPITVGGCGEAAVATITLICTHKINGAVTLDTLSINITDARFAGSFAGNHIYNEKNSCTAPNHPYCNPSGPDICYWATISVMVEHIYCDGSMAEPFGYASWNCYCMTLDDCFNTRGMEERWEDSRSQNLIDQGCCPPQLM
jgi:hypothetical protein